MSKIIDEPETENWSDHDLRFEISNCGISLGKWAFVSCIAGIAAYPYLIKRLLQKYTNYEIRSLITGVCLVSTMFGSGYYAQKQCKENVKELFSEGRRKDLEKQKQSSK